MAKRQSRILGPDGQPLELPRLDEPQTAHLSTLQRELATHPTRGLTPTRLAQILDAAESGDLLAQYDLYEDMEEKDGHIASEMNKRRRACILDWEVLPPQKSPSAQEKKSAAQLDELVQEIPDFESILYDATDAIGKGFACLEIEWHRIAPYWIPKSITHRPQNWFTLHRAYRQQLRLRGAGIATDGQLGQPLQPFGWITHIHKAKSGYLERAALFRQLVWTYLFKNYSVGDLAEFLEIYGIPLRVGKYHNGASEAEKLTLLRALSGIAHNAAGIIPESMMLEFHDAAKGDPKAFELMMSWCERNQSKVILGATLTSGADGKSSTNALGLVHNEVRKDLRDSDIRQLSTTISRDLVYAIGAINGLLPDGPRRAPVFALNAQEHEDLSTYAQALPALVSLGLRPSLKWAHEKLGIPLAEAGEPTLMPSSPAPAQVAGYSTAKFTAAAAPTAHYHPPTTQALINPLAARIAPAQKPWIDAIGQLVEQSSSLEDIRDGLAALLPDMALDDYAAAMSQALACAQLAGRYDVMQEAAGAGHG